MVSELNITEYLYKILNVSSITDLLNSGFIYKDSRPTNSNQNDIVINTNFLRSSYNSGVSVGLSNINIYCQANKNGYPNHNFFKSVFTKIIERFEEINYNYKSLYFSIDMTSTEQDSNQLNWFYFNIRLNIQENTSYLS